MNDLKDPGFNTGVSSKWEKNGAVKRSSRYLSLQKNLARGWNTWNTRSLLSHVFLPDGFAINLGIKEFRQGGHLKEALIGRRNQEKIAAGPHAYDGSYTELDLNWRDIDVKVQTAAEGDELVILVTPSHRQKKTPLLVAESGFLWNRKGELASGDDVLIGRTSSGRSIHVYGTQKSTAEPYITAQTPYLAFSMDGPIGISTGKKRSLKEITSLIFKKKNILLESHTARFGEDAGIYRAIQAGLAWNTIYDPMKNRVITPVSRLWNLGWDEPTVGDQSSVGDPVQYLGYVLFCWDTYFAGYLHSLEHKELAYANAVEITKELTPGGFVPMWYRSLGIRTQDRSQPPLGSMIIRELYRRFGDKWLLEEVYEDLIKWNRWWPENRLNQGFLSWGSDPYEPVTGFDWEIKGVGNLYGAVLESGMDNLPLYDDAVYNEKTHLMEMADTALLSFYIRDCESLAEIAGILGKEEEEQELNRRADQFRQKLMDLWHDEEGIFLNRRLDNQEWVHRLSPTLFYPLLAGAATRVQAERMIKDHYFNDREFAGEWVMPAVSRDDPAFHDNVYWRGRIWPPMNFLVYIGLRRYGLSKAQADMAEKSKNLLMKTWKEKQLIPENYNAETGEGLDVSSSDSFYHWGGLLGLIFLIEKGLVPGPEQPLPNTK